MGQAMVEPKAVDAERELTKLMNDWFTSIQRRDSGWFQRVLADDWAYVMIDGSVRNKAWYVGQVSQPFDGDVSAEIHQLTTRIYGPIVIATGHYTVKGVREGKDLSSHTRFTSVWRRDGDEWRALVHHATRIQE